MKALYVKAIAYVAIVAVVEVTKAVKARKLHKQEDAKRFDNAKLVVEVSACTDLAVV